MIKELIEKKCAVIPYDESSPIAFINVYEAGDVWIKVKGCEDCPEERRRMCCGNCPMITPDAWCSWQMEKGKSSSKPLYCVVFPTPDTCKPNCVIIYKCIKGSHKGKVKHAHDSKGVIR